jgi:hypothetical protein
MITRSVGRDLLAKAIRLAAGVGKHLLREGARQAELRDHRLRVDAGLAGAAEHLDDHSFAILEMRGKTHHLHDDLVVLAHALRAGIAHGDRPREMRAIDLHPARPRRLEIAADESRRPPLHHLDDLTGRPGPADVPRPREPHPHGVAAGGVERRVGGDVDVAGAVTGGGVERAHEPISACRPAKHADDIAGRRLRRPLAAGRTARRAVAALHDWPRPRKNFRPWLC